MRFRHPGTAISLSALIGACAIGPSPEAAEWRAQLASAPRCALTVDGVDTTWREVQSKGFRICLPHNWTLYGRVGDSGDPYGFGGWRSPTGLRLTWRYNPSGFEFGCGSDRTATSLPRGQYEWTEEVGGEDVCFVRNNYHVRGHWRGGLMLSGDGRVLEDPPQMIAAIRTIRLGARGSTSLPPPAR